MKSLSKILLNNLIKTSLRLCQRFNNLLLPRNSLLFSAKDFLFCGSSGTLNKRTPKSSSQCSPFASPIISDLRSAPVNVESAVRLVSNNCQLNYKNYRALTSNELQWITFSPPDDRDSLRTYAELMTMFDNPKFPDQLSALGGDQQNYRLPWEKAAANPRNGPQLPARVVRGQ